MDFERDYSKELFNNRETLYSQGSYTNEKKLSELIREGSVQGVEMWLKNHKKRTIGNMSLNPFRNHLYATILCISMVTRAAVDGGMLEDDAYTLSDIYIRKADMSTRIEQLNSIYETMILDFAKRVKEYQETENNSYVVKAVKEYIIKNLHYDINMKDISEKVELSENYISTVFKKETGETISYFIQKNRIREAESLLKYSEYSIIEIANYLGFSSQSYFSRIFQKIVYISPGQYRKKHFNKTW